MTPILIDGSQGEGGGQVLRSSLTLAMATGRPFAIEKIRAGRRRPGLMRQHLTAVRAAAAVCGARVEGDRIGSSRLVFTPGPVTHGDHHFAVGTAGSTTLVLQTVLPVLLTAPGPSRLVLEGGTHNPMAPPFPFLAETFLPLVERMGPRFAIELERPGFYPAGGGRLRLDIEPCPALRPFELFERGEILGRRARALVAHIDPAIGRRELAVVRKRLGWGDDQLEVIEVPESAGPGNLLVLQVETTELTETFAGFGRHGLRAEAVADGAVRQMRRWLEAEVPVGEHLADQLLLPLALAGGGGFTTLPLARHATTQIELICRFLPVEITTETDARRRVTIRIGGG